MVKTTKLLLIYKIKSTSKLTTH